jgi:hypothetical protein
MNRFLSSISQANGCKPSRLKRGTQKPFVAGATKGFQAHVPVTPDAAHRLERTHQPFVAGATKVAGPWPARE